MAEPKEVDQSAFPTDLKFYNDRPPLKESARKLMLEYSKIPENEVESHIESIRQRAFSIFPYPCIGMVRFLDLSILTQSVYGEVLQRTKDGEKLLDLGCCFGQEIRQLVLDGAPPENLFGSDLEPDFFKLGYELFRDDETLTSKFIAADVFNPDSPLKELNGSMNIIYTGSFFHLFSYDQQLLVAKRVVELLAPVPGSILVGRHVGNTTPGETAMNAPGNDWKPYRHNKESWQALWGIVGEQTGSRWNVQVEMEDQWFGLRGHQSVASKSGEEVGMKRMAFVVRRL